MQAKERVEAPKDGARAPLDGAAAGSRPLLLIDIDGVISLFGVPEGGDVDGNPIDGSLRFVDGTPHFLSATAAAHLLALAKLYELVWASGWEERADEHLPHLLGLPPGLPFLRFARDVGGHSAPRAHWKLDAIDAYAGERPLAWVDDALNPACEAWAQRREAPTLLVHTDPRHGLTTREAQLLSAWAHELARAQPREGNEQPPAKRQR